METVFVLTISNGTDSIVPHVRMVKFGNLPVEFVSVQITWFGMDLIVFYAKVVRFLIPILKVVFVQLVIHGLGLHAQLFVHLINSGILL